MASKGRQRLHRVVKRAHQLDSEVQSRVPSGASSKEAIQSKGISAVICQVVGLLAIRHYHDYKQRE